MGVIGIRSENSSNQQQPQHLAWGSNSSLNSTPINEPNNTIQNRGRRNSSSRKKKRKKNRNKNNFFNAGGGKAGGGKNRRRRSDSSSNLERKGLAQHQKK